MAPLPSLTKYALGVNFNLITNEHCCTCSECSSTGGVSKRILILPDFEDPFVTYQTVVTILPYFGVISELLHKLQLTYFANAYRI